MLINQIGQPLCRNISFAKLPFPYPILLIFDDKNFTELEVPKNWEGIVCTSKDVYDRIIENNYTLNIEKNKVCILQSNTETEIFVDDNKKFKLAMFTMGEGMGEKKLIFIYEDDYILNMYTNINILSNLNVFMKNKNLVSIVKRGIDVLYIDQGLRKDEANQIVFSIQLKSLYHLVRPKKMYLFNGELLTSKCNKNISTDLWK